MYPESQRLFERAQRSIPGGVNSPVRAFRQVGGTPLFISHAQGAYLYDADGHRYIDYIASWGPMILGHAHEPVIRAIQEYAPRSLSYGAPTELEIQLAEQVIRMVQGVELVRFVSSGTEACMSAIRLARGFTGRNKIIKFEGHYHGHADALLVKAGSGVATLGIQHVPGIPASVAADTVVLPFNDLPSVEQTAQAHHEQIAAIIVEPVAGNMGCVPPASGFLEGLRALCDRYGIILILDEVMTGFRLAPGGAQEKLNVRGDLVVYGKVIGGGMPVGAFGGRRDIMSCIAPLGQVYQAGTLSGNPIAMIAGLTTLQTLADQPSIYEDLETKSAYLGQGLQRVFNAAPFPAVINRFGSMISVHFSTHPVVDFHSAAQADLTLFKQYFHFLLESGIYLPPSPFESWFLNQAMTQTDLDDTIAATERWVHTFSR